MYPVLEARLRADALPTEENMNGMIWCRREVTIPLFLSTKQVSYQLDDDGEMVEVVGVEPTFTAFKAQCLAIRRNLNIFYLNKQF